MRILATSLGVMLLAGGLFSGCERPEPEAAAPETPTLATSAPPPMTERRSLEARPSKARFGEACDATGDEGCASGLCFKTFGPVGEGHRCTKACAGDNECGSGWRCMAIVPSLPETYCMPPQPQLPEVAP